MSTSYISSGVQSVGRVASVSPYMRGLRSRFRFRGRTLPALLTLIKNKKKAENVGKKNKKRGRINKNNLGKKFAAEIVRDKREKNTVGMVSLFSCSFWRNSDNVTI